MQIDVKSITWDEPTGIVWDDEPKKKEDQRPLAQRLIQDGSAGLVRGAGSIGATLLTPYDLIAGNTKSIGNPERRKAMDEAFASMGVDTNGMIYGGGKLVGEVAGTAGAGGVLANGLRMIPGAAKVAPLIDAIGSSGMTAGGATGKTALASRVTGGALTGGVSAGLVSPEDAGTGATIGGVLPPALMLAGKAGTAAGRMMRGGEQTPEMAAAVRAAQEAGYVIPPTQANPSAANKIMEGLAGKISTAQNASARNQGVTNKLAAEALGLPADTKLTPELLQEVRAQAGRSYARLGSTGVITPGEAYGKALDKIAEPFKLTAEAFPNAAPSPVLSLVESLRTPAFASASAVEKIKQLRTLADDSFRTGNTDVGRAAKSAAAALEDTVDAHLQSLGAPELLKEFRDARQLIAKTYTVEKALNPASGSVDARKLAAQLKKGKPLSGELLTAGRFGLQFPKAAQAVEGMGSLPQVSPLDWAMGGSISAATANPLGMLTMAARPAARAAALSGPVQRGLLQSPGGPMLLDGPFSRAGLLSAPILGIDQ